MAFPTGWTRKAAVTVDATKVGGSSGALSDFPLLLTQANLPPELFDSDGANPAQADGGDIRFTADEAGTVRLPADIRIFATDPDPANGKAKIFVLVAFLSASADTAIYVWWNSGAGEVQPAGDVAAVYADYVAVWPLAAGAASRDLQDLTGNGHTLSVRNGAPSASVDWLGNPGEATRFEDSGTESLSAPHSPALSLRGSGETATVTGWVRAASLDSGFANSWIGKDNEWSAQYVDDAGGGGTATAGLRLSVFGDNNKTQATKYLNAGEWHRAALFWVSGTRFSTKDNNNPADAKASSDISDEDTTMGILIGVHSTSSSVAQPFWDGEIAEVWITALLRSEDWLDTEYANQSSPETFASAGAPQAVEPAGIAGSGAAAVPAATAAAAGQQTVAGQTGVLAAAATAAGAGSLVFSGTAATLLSRLAAAATSGNSFIGASAALMAALAAAAHARLRDGAAGHPSAAALAGAGAGATALAGAARAIAEALAAAGSGLVEVRFVSLPARTLAVKTEYRTILVDDEGRLTISETDKRTIN